MIHLGPRPTVRRSGIFVQKPGPSRAYLWEAFPCRPAAYADWLLETDMSSAYRWGAVGVCSFFSSRAARHVGR